MASLRNLAIAVLRRAGYTNIAKACAGPATASTTHLPFSGSADFAGALAVGVVLLAEDVPEQPPHRLEHLDAVEGGQHRK